MAYVPRFTLRSADNSTEIYHFTAAQDTNLPRTDRRTVVISSLRAKGAVVIDGGIKEFDGTLQFILWDNSGEYSNLMALIDDLETKIPINTPFILRIPKTETTYNEYRVKRIVPFEYPNVKENKRIYRQDVTATFLVDAW